MLVNKMSFSFPASSVRCRLRLPFFRPFFSCWVVFNPPLSLFVELVVVPMSAAWANRLPQAPSSAMVVNKIYQREKMGRPRLPTPKVQTKQGLRFPCLISDCGVINQSLSGVMSVSFENGSNQSTGVGALVLGGLAAFWFWGSLDLGFAMPCSKGCACATGLYQYQPGTVLLFRIVRFVCYFETTKEWHFDAPRLVSNSKLMTLKSIMRYGGSVCNTSKTMSQRNHAIPVALVCPLAR